MFKYYIKIAFRNFRTNKLLFAGSLATISLGALCISLLFSYVHNELTMNDFHKRGKDIYLTIVRNGPESQWSVFQPSEFSMIDYKDFPEVENSVSYKYFEKGKMKLTYSDAKFSPEGIKVDSTFFKVFDFKLKVGDKNSILNDPNSIVISEKLAEIMFGDENPIGKKVTLNYFTEKDFIVAGIFEDPPSNSIMTFDFMIPENSGRFFGSGTDFLLMKNHFDKAAFLKKIESLGERHPAFKKSKLGIVSLESMYYNKHNISEAKNIFNRSGNEKNSYIIFIVIIVILTISVLNFSNLQVININSNIKEIGINMIHGAQPQNQIFQKFVEIGVLIGLSAILINGLFHLLLPFFNKLMGTTLSPDLWQVLLLNIIILVVLASLVLIYPIVVMWRMSLIKSLKNKSYSENQLVGRKLITTIQYSLTIILLVASIVVAKQLNLMITKDLGYSHKNVITTKIFHHIPYPENSDDVDVWNEYKRQNDNQLKSIQFVKNELTSHSAIYDFSRGTTPLEMDAIPWKINDNTIDYTTENTLNVTPSYINIYDFELVEGRFFDKEKDKSRQLKLVINEAAKKHWGIEDISENRIVNSYFPNEYEIIGVVKDFNYEHLSVKPRPVLMNYFEFIDAEFIIKFREGAVQEGLKFVENLFIDINPREPFEYSFLSDEIAALYQKEKRLSIIYMLFTIIALIISAIGLFTIALYDTQKRVKEIGIRKVNGATIKEILIFLNKDFMLWVLVAFIIACPIAFYSVSKWLENFAYKTDLSWWIFALAGSITFTIAILSVSWQSLKAAKSNPVESLRDE